MQKQRRLQKSSRCYSMEKDALDCILRHAQEAYPNEACGVLCGPEGDPFRILKGIPTSNADGSLPRRRYMIDPRELLRIYEDLEGQGMEVVGFYHSHPDHPATPSDFDRERAWEGYLYLIVSVVGGFPTTWRAWAWDPQAEEFSEAQIQLRQFWENTDEGPTPGEKGE